ncbi:MAG TPA: hypothetical protein VHA06_05640 [Candidatus Angelobacter sp.]|jgi:hypothetical protein|nr:hypothetical protein [Candidatus Angelobacter sp.]
MAWELWAEVGPYKQSPKLIREVRIQAHKLTRMLDNQELGMSAAEVPGHKASKNVLKKRGKLHRLAEKQYKKLLATVEASARAGAEKDADRSLTRAELKKIMDKFRARMTLVVNLMKEKYPIESLVKE